MLPSTTEMLKALQKTKVTVINSDLNTLFNSSHLEEA